MGKSTENLIQIHTSLFCVAFFAGGAVRDLLIAKSRRSLLRGDRMLAAEWELDHLPYSADEQDRVEQLQRAQLDVKAEHANEQMCHLFVLHPSFSNQASFLRGARHAAHLGSKSVEATIVQPHPATLTERVALVDRLRRGRAIVIVATDLPDRPHPFVCPGKVRLGKCGRQPLLLVCLAMSIFVRREKLQVFLGVFRHSNPVK